MRGYSTIKYSSLEEMYYDNDDDTTTTTTNNNNIKQQQQQQQQQQPTPWQLASYGTLVGRVIRQSDRVGLEKLLK